MIKSFRGLLADSGQETIRLGTNQGLRGYRIVKFEIIPNEPFNKDQESVVKLYKYKQETVTDDINFADGTLLGVAITTNENVPGTGYMMPMQIIFDNEVFNQDIFITHKDQDNGELCNYYLELEQLKLDVNEASVATLKDMRGTN